MTGTTIEMLPVLGRAAAILITSLAFTGWMFGHVTAFGVGVALAAGAEVYLHWSRRRPIPKHAA